MDAAGRASSLSRDIGRGRARGSVDTKILLTRPKRSETGGTKVPRYKGTKVLSIVYGTLLSASMHTYQHLGTKVVYGVL